MFEFDPVGYADVPLCGEVDVEAFRGYFGVASTLALGLMSILQWRNGFYAYDGSFLMRPFDTNNLPLGVVQWNQHELWKVYYNIDLSKTVCFAEDIFGFQYCIRGSRIALFDPESGSLEDLASSFEQFSAALKADRSNLSGSPFLTEWAKRYGSLPHGHRLIAKVPFVCGGAFTVDNFAAVSDVRGMICRAALSNQIQDVPDGGKIVFRIEP